MHDLSSACDPNAYACNVRCSEAARLRACAWRRLKDRNRLAQRKYRRKRRERLQTTEERLAFLESKVKALTSDKVFVNLTGSMLCHVPSNGTSCKAIHPGLGERAKARGLRVRRNCQKRWLDVMASPMVARRHAVSRWSMLALLL